MKNATELFGLLQASFIPPKGQRDLRDLTRYRTKLVQERVREVNRVQGVLERANIKLASVIADIMGVSGRALLEALIAGRTDPGVLDGTYTLWSFTDEAVQRSQIRDLLARISVSEDPRCADNDPLLETRSSGSRGFVEVEAMRKDGRRETVRVDKAPGHPARELTWDDLAAKFMDCAAQTRIDLSKAQQAFGLLTQLETCSDIAEVVALLH